MELVMRHPQDIGRVWVRAAHRLVKQGLNSLPLRLVAVQLLELRSGRLVGVVCPPVDQRESRDSRPEGRNLWSVLPQGFHVGSLAVSMRSETLGLEVLTMKMVLVPPALPPLTRHRAPSILTL